MNAFLSPILERARREPRKVFAEIWVGNERTSLSWGSLIDRAMDYANHYRHLGASKKDVIFLTLKHGPDLYPAYLGAMLVGSVPSFLPFPSQKQDLDLYWASHAKVFRRSEARLLLTYHDLVPDAMSRLPSGFTITTTQDVRERRSTFNSELPTDDEIALLQHSSGTTGLKKGVALTYRAIVAQLRDYSESLALGRTDVIASWLPLYHDMGLIACFLLPVWCGFKVISLDAFEWTERPYLLLKAISEAKATHVWLPNFAFAHIARTTSRSMQFDLKSLKAAIGCSEPNKPSTFEDFIERFSGDGLRMTALQTCYAMAETVFAVSQSPPGAVPRRCRIGISGSADVKIDPEGPITLLSNGPPLHGIEVRVMRDSALVDKGTAGEICVRGKYLFDGYFNDGQATNASFVDGWFKTGDLGFIHEGEIYIFGRIKDVLIVNGKNFYSHDIELIVNDIDGVKKGRSVAFGIFVPAAGTEQIVVVSERSGNTENDESIRAHINEAVNRHLGTACGDIRLVDPGWLVKTTSGKISRSENSKRYVEQFRPDAQSLISKEI